MTQYPGYEIERFESEGGNCYYLREDEPNDQELKEIPVIDLLTDENEGKDDDYS
jgi:hypothetical protein